MLTTLSQSAKKKFFFEILLVHEIQKSTNDNFLIKKKNILASFPSSEESQTPYPGIQGLLHLVLIYLSSFPCHNGSSQGVSPCLSSPALAKVTGAPQPHSSWLLVPDLNREGPLKATAQCRMCKDNLKKKSLSHWAATSLGPTSSRLGIPPSPGHWSSAFNSSSDGGLQHLPIPHQFLVFRGYNMYPAVRL